MKLLVQNISGEQEQEQATRGLITRIKQVMDQLVVLTSKQSLTLCVIAPQLSQLPLRNVVAACACVMRREE